MDFKWVTVGVVQAAPTLFDLVIGWINKVAAAGYQLVLFPKSFILCYPYGVNFNAVVGQWVRRPLLGQEGVLVADLDFATLDKSKLDFDSVGHYARPDVFKLDVVNQPVIFKG